MREVELKAVVDDIVLRRGMVEGAGGELVYEGRLIDRRYGDSSGTLLLNDHVLRVRIYESASGREGSLDWKGPTQYEDGYKVREEVSTPVGDPDALLTILENLGYSIILEIDRRIWQYALAGATVRFEQYPRMDTLLEVEGVPEAIEKAIAATGIDRQAFSPERLPDFVARFEARTGERAALSASELAGEYRYGASSA